MLGSHALHISRRGTSEVDEQSVPLASSLAGSSTKPAAFFGNKKERQARRGSLVDTAFARAVPEEVQLRAIAEVTENPRRASVAIRRQSLIQSLQNEDGNDQPRDSYRSPGRGSIRALIPGPPPATTRISAFPGNVYSIAEQGDTNTVMLPWQDADDLPVLRMRKTPVVAALSPHDGVTRIDRCVVHACFSQGSACHRAPCQQHPERQTGAEEQRIRQER